MTRGIDSGQKTLHGKAKRGVKYGLTQTQLHQYSISIQLGEKVEHIAKTPELWQ